MGVLTHAVTLDVLGTLVRLEPPGPRLRSLLAAEGIEVEAERAEAGFRAEIAYYLEHHLEGGEPAGLERLRAACARELGAALGVSLAPERLQRLMMESLEFTPFPDAVPALQELRSRGVRLVACTNWDVSVSGQLERVGLLELLDGVVSSAEAGAAKPNPAVFEAALRLAGAAPAEALHVGDSPEADVAGARAAGMRAVLLDREGGVRHLEYPYGCESAEPPSVVSSLADLPSLISGAA